jgi:hypothetical protein
MILKQLMTVYMGSGEMAYWDRQNGTTTLDDAISAVKLQFPKP